MGEKRWFLIEWIDGKAYLLTQPSNNQEEVMAQYKTLEPGIFAEVCETIYG